MAATWETRSPTEPQLAALAPEWRTPGNDLLADIAFYETEAAVSAGTAPTRAAPLVHEAAHLREREPGLDRESVKSYAHSLTLDPGYAPNAWALRRIFSRRGFWDNLVRVLDAEIRFSAWGRASDRADLQVERGRLLEDRLGRDREAQESYRAALEVCPDHPGALWALLLAGWRSGDAAAAEEALGGLLRRTAEPGARALFALELARQQRRTEGATPGGEALGRAAETLFRALSSGAEAPSLLRELDRLSLLAAADKTDIRLRFLDAFESRLVRDALSGPILGARDPLLAAVVSNQREKARILLRRGARDAALAVLERTLRVAPAHPLVQLDFLDAAEEAGRPDAIVAMVEGPLAVLPPEAQAEALLRRAQIAEKAGALGEAIGALERIPASSGFAPLVALARLRVLARLQDADGLARAFAEAADQLADGDERQRREAAHLLVRAATARQQALDESGGAESDLRQALVLTPGYGPAATAMAALLGRASRFSDLAAFVETQAVAGVMPRPLREALVVLYRDVLRDGPEALRHQRALLEAAEDADVRAHVRTVDAAGLAAPAAGAEAAAAGRASLAWLAERAPAGPVRGALRLLAARFADGTDPGATEELLREAFEDDPAGPAAGSLEQLHRGRDEGRRREWLELELRRAEAGGRAETARALHYRLAFAAAAARKTDEAIAQLAPLRERGDRLASAWSLDLARQAGDGNAEIALLGELARRAASAGDDNVGATELTSAFERTRALGEALEQLGDRAGAAQAYQEASTRAADGDPGQWADVELGIFRSHVAAGQTGEAVASLRRLALFVEGEAGASVRREAALVALSAGLPSDEVPGAASADAVWRWLRGVRNGDAAEVVAGLEAILLATPGPSSTPLASQAALWTAVAARRAFLGHGEAPLAIERAARALGEATADGDGTMVMGVLAVVATDLLGPGTLSPPLARLRRARASRLAQGSAAERRLAEALLLEEALEAEAGGHLSTAAAIYGEVLAEDPLSMEATEGLHRIAEATQDRRAQAAALARRGSLSLSRRRGAEAYAEAALLLQDEGADGEAARLFLEVLARTPDDDEAYRRLHDILSRREDSAGLERLLSFRLQQTSDQAARVRLFAERARLRLGQRRDLPGAVHDYQRILQLDPRHGESLRALGELALEQGHFRYAARVLAEALAQADGDGAAVGTLRLQLAEAQEASGDLTAAIGTLTIAAEAARPDDTEPSERLVALAIRRRDHAMALAQLGVIEARTRDPATRASALVRIGRLERDGRHDQARALAAFRRALVSDPLGEGAAELLALVGGGVPLDEAGRRAVDGVITDLRATLVAGDPLDVRRLERLRDLARLRGLADLAEVAGQLLGALAMAVERGRARDLTRPIGPAALVGLMGDGSALPAGLMGEIWPLLGEAAARLEGLDPGQLGASRHTRVAPGVERRLGWLDAAAFALGLSPLTVHVAGTDDLAVVALDTPEPVLVVGRGVLGGDPASRFRVGRALFLLRQRAACVERLPIAQVDEMARAAALLAGARRADADPAALKAAIKNLGRALGRRELRALEPLRARLEVEPLDAAAWRAAVLRGADRFGLVVAGDLAACLRAQTGAGDLRGTDLRRTECLELVRFALDERYAAVRREVGVLPGDR
jgi:tetratricopeptide (TPR) repeat protein